jgi:hypothetical protein
VSTNRRWTDGGPDPKDVAKVTDDDSILVYGDNGFGFGDWHEAVHSDGAWRWSSDTYAGPIEDAVAWRPMPPSPLLDDDGTELTELLSSVVDLGRQVENLEVRTEIKRLAQSIADRIFDKTAEVTEVDHWIPSPPDKPEECRCPDMRTKLVGDGCQVCNPELARDLAENDEDAAKGEEA